ncbi:homeobox KN domain-containing protein [Nemania sp. NC0429]|nr:homeobox KN domain-containing protein [Nemania sp. NC0429]
MRPHHHNSGHHEPASKDQDQGHVMNTQGEQGRIALPPIRVAIPELAQEGPAGRPTSMVSPTGTRTPLGYNISPNSLKRSRFSFEREEEPNRGRWLPPVDGPEQARSRPHSSLTHRSWADSEPHSRSYTNNDTFLPRRSPDGREAYERPEPRPTLPSLPPLNLDRGTHEIIRQGHPRDAYILEPPRQPNLVPINDRFVDLAGHGYQPAGYNNYGYPPPHPHRVQSLPIGPAYDRTPFSPGAYNPHYQETFMRMGDMGLGPSGEGKPRKRRGNLPKETTDKLRAWFIAHLHHPYPTEDEKQELIRQTGLQMNQISNWFINARRRQLPAMISNAQIEKKAMGGRAADSTGLSPSERHYDNEGKHGTESEGSNYGDSELESAKRHRTTHWKRDSI